MKILTRAILFSTLLILAMSQDPCTRIFQSAEESLNTFKSNFLAENYDAVPQDFINLRMSMENIRRTCDGDLVNLPGAVEHMPCSLIRVQIIAILENYSWDRVGGSAKRQDIASNLEEIVVFTSKIDAQNCIDEWSLMKTSSQQGLLNDNVMWPDMNDLDSMTMGQKEHESDFSALLNIIEVEHENSDGTDSWSEIRQEAKEEQKAEPVLIHPYFELEGELIFNENTEEISVYVSMYDIVGNLSEEKRQDHLITALFAIDFELAHGEEAGELELGSSEVDATISVFVPLEDLQKVLTALEHTEEDLDDISVYIDLDDVNEAILHGHHKDALIQALYALDTMAYGEDAGELELGLSEVDATISVFVPLEDLQKSLTALEHTEEDLDDISVYVDLDDVNEAILHGHHKDALIQALYALDAMANGEDGFGDAESHLLAIDIPISVYVPIENVNGTYVAVGQESETAL